MFTSNFIAEVLPKRRRARAEATHREAGHTEKKSLLRPPRPHTAARVSDASDARVVCEITRDGAAAAAVFREELEKRLASGLSCGFGGSTRITDEGHALR